MEAKVLNPTPEMLHIRHLYTSTRDNIIVDSYAGTGKTTLAEQLIAATPVDKQVLYLVFTKKNKEEAETRFADKTADGIVTAPVLIKNLNGFGFGVWQETLGRRFGVNQKKTLELFTGLVDSLKRSQKDEAWAQYSEIKSAIGFAKS
jgi:superfamily II DNA or RNA helicase